MVRKLQGYDELRKIAEGRDRIIYSGVRKSDQKSFIFKALRSEHPSPEVIALMFHEYEVSKDLHFPGIIEIFDFIHDQNQYTLVEEDMQGIPLYEYLQKNPITDLNIFFKLAIQMTQSVAELHAHYIIHKDIKPSNYIIDPNTLTVKLTDFNFSSKLFHEMQHIVPPSKLEGTLLYMAPEQSGRMNMNIDYRVDFYSLGVTFFEMLCGQIPFDYADPLELLHAHLANPVPDLTNAYIEIPPVLKEIVNKLMSKNPSDRYQSAIGIQADLERCQASLEKTGKIKSFPLGQQDVFDRLNLSQKLYGRLEEAQILLAAYDRASQGSVEALMVCGYSGIGKTMLINEVHKPMVKDKGYFISGKFDQLARNTPYTAMTQAFNEIARQILAEPDSRFQKIKKELLDALGGVAQVIIDLAPEMELILGPQPPLEEIGPNEAQNRRMIFFKRFLNVIANKDHPLVIFIDDLQWIDSGSLKLLEYILTDEELSHVLLIGAYRDNEVDDDHPLNQLFKQIRNKGKEVSTLSLGPLTQSDFEALFQDSFNRKDESLKSFSNLIHKRTEGNPFFCKQVINTLYKEQLLYFDYTQRRWDWNLDGIIALKITDNVVDLMLRKLSELPENTQTMLKYAACIGNRFSIETLKLVSEKPLDEIGRVLWPALEQELILTLRLGYKRLEALKEENLAIVLSKGISFQFAHDRVQQAVYQGIAPEERKKIHLSLARLLLEKEPETATKERLFELVDHFNEAYDLLEGAEKMQVAELNYKAGLKARSANAYQPMSNYLKIALILLGENAWNTSYDLTFAVNCEFAWSLFLLNRLEEAQNLVKSLLEKTKQKLDRVKLDLLQIKIYGVQGQFDEALEVIIKSLRMLGIKVVENPTKFNVLSQLIQFRWLMRRFHVERLEKELPTIEDPSTKAAFDLLLEILYPASWKGGVYVSYFGMIAVNLILRTGKPKAAAGIFMMYPLIIRYSSRDVDAIFKYWNLVERLFLESQDKYSSSQMYPGYTGTLLALRYPIKTGDDYLLRAIQYATESGNISAVGVIKSSLAGQRRNEGQSLKEMCFAAEKAIQALKESGQKDWQTMVEISLLTFKIQMNGMKEYEEPLNILKQTLLRSQSDVLKGIMFMNISPVHYFLENYERAVRNHWQWYKVIQGIVQVTTHSELAKAIDALSIIKCLPKVNMWKRWTYQKRIRLIMSELKWISGEQPGNFLHCYLCVKGEYLKWKGYSAEALKDFDAAIENAKKGNFYLWVAVANELAGEMLMEQNQPRFAKDYIREASYFYDRYGMMPKVHSLHEHYPQCFSEQYLADSEISKNEVSRTSNITGMTSASLDFMSVIKASQAISGEIITEKLFEKMLHILVENAGAEKAFFIERLKDFWVVIARLSPQEEKDKFEMLNVPLMEFENLPQTLLQFSIRTGEIVMLRDACENNQYQQDPYFVRTQAKSVLCLPVIHQDKVLGIIYLENNQTTEAFTQDRITVLSTLAAQIAISLENARHFEYTEQLYQATERFVPKPFLKLLNREHVEDVQLGDSIELNVTVLFTDIRGYTTLMEKMNPQEAYAFINSYLSYVSPIIRSHEGFISQYLGDGIMALFPGEAEDALDAVLEMEKALVIFNQEQSKLNQPTIRVGCGLNTGPAMIGTIGEKGRMDANVISDAVNLASRIESLNKYYGTEFLVSENTINSLSDIKSYKLRLVDKVRVKGKKNAIRLYQVYPKGILDEHEQEFIDTYEEAFKAYEKGELAQALESFQKCQSLKPEEPSSAIMIERCQQLLKNGVPSDWDGTYVMMLK